MCFVWNLCTFIWNMLETCIVNHVYTRLQVGGNPPAKSRCSFPQKPGFWIRIFVMLTPKCHVRRFTEKKSRNVFSFFVVVLWNSVLYSQIERFFHFDTLVRPNENFSLNLTIQNRISQFGSDRVFHNFGNHFSWCLHTIPIRFRLFPWGFPKFFFSIDRNSLWGFPPSPKPWAHKIQNSRGVKVTSPSWKPIFYEIFWLLFLKKLMCGGRSAPIRPQKLHA